MNTFSFDELEAMCVVRLEQFVGVNGHDRLPLPMHASLAEIVGIASKNLRAKRLERQNQFRARAAQLTPEDYVDRIIAVWCEEQPKWCCLRARDPQMWNWLRDDLTRAARQMLVKRPSPGSSASVAEDYVQRAALKILRYDYHFDMPLLVWARSILKNTIREPDRSSDALDQWHFSLEEGVSTGGSSDGASLEYELTDSTTEKQMQQIRERDVILQNLAKLTPLRQAVLILTLFEELPDTEIARRLEISMTHLHSTRHRALKQLCELIRNSELQE